MYEMQPAREDQVTGDRPTTRRALHAVAAAAPTTPNNASSVPTPTHAPTVIPTRRTLHSAVRETARDLPRVPENQRYFVPSAPEQSATSAPQRTLKHGAPERPVHTQAKHPHTQLFDISSFGPISPESATLTSSQASAPLNLREPSIAELMWLEEMRSHLKLPTAPRLTAKELSEVYDAYCTAWHAHSRRNKWDHFFVATAVGIGIGDLLVLGSTDCKWVVSEDGKDITYAVRDEAHRATYFPIDAVNRRWLAGKLEWIPDFVDNALASFTEGTPLACDETQS